MSCSSSVALALPTRLVVALALFVSLTPRAGQAETPPIFQTPALVDSGGFATESAVIADVNRDGKPDLIVAIQNDPFGAHLTNGLVGVVLGNGDGTFGTPVIYDSGGNDAVSVAVADLNGDGAPDIVVGNSCVWLSSGCSFTTAGVLLGGGDGTFAPAVPVNLGGSSSQQIAIADVNGDDKPDLLAIVAAPFNGAVAILLGNGDGTFQAPTLVLLGGMVMYSLAVGDVNGDGRPDVVASGAGGSGGPSRGIARVLLGNGDGTFQISPTPYDSGVSAGGWANSVALGDLNGDGALDLAIANYPDSTTGVLLGNGDGTFGSTVLYDSGSRLAWVNTIADVNGDSKRDLIVANAAGAVGVLVGNGDGTFQPPQTYAIPGDALSVVAADVNRDGRPDLAVAVGNTLTAVLLNSSPCNSTAPIVTVAASPTILWPPNSRAIPVSLSGSVGASGCSLNLISARYVVQDEYGQVQPQGAVAIDNDGMFSFNVQLPASRRGDDRDGRKYTITISAQATGGAIGSATAIVTVPHNQ
jgi:hypothetical protein